MRLLIIGAGTVGRYAARLFREREWDVYVVDHQLDCVKEIQQSMDVGVVHGNGSCPNLLKEFEPEKNSTHLLAVTNDDATNLLCCTIAKQLGYEKTIARVKDNPLYDFSQKFLHQLPIDCLVCPDTNVAQAVHNTLTEGSSHTLSQVGAVSMCHFTVGENYPFCGQVLKDIALAQHVLVALITHADGQVTFPHGDTTLQKGDLVTLVGTEQALLSMHKWFPKPIRQNQPGLLIGDQALCIKILSLCPQKKWIVLGQDAQRCQNIAETFPNACVYCHNSLDREFLHSEHFEQCQEWVITTTNDHQSICIALMAQQLSVKKIIICLNDMRLKQLAKKSGAHTVIGLTTQLDNQLLFHLHDQKIRPISSLSDGAAELIEIYLSLHSTVIGYSLKQLSNLFPRDFLVVGLQNRQNCCIPNGDTVLVPGDTLICVTSPKHLEKLKDLF